MYADSETGFYYWGALLRSAHREIHISGPVPSEFLNHAASGIHKNLIKARAGGADARLTGLGGCPQGTPERGDRERTMTGVSVANCKITAPPCA